MIFASFSITRFRLLLCLCLAAHSLEAAVDHNLFTELLADHVAAGRVDYASLQDDSRLDQYLAGFSKTDPTSLPDEASRLAFWINAYNAFTLKLVAQEYPVDSIHDLGTGGRIIGWLLNRTPWDIRFAEIGDRTYTLNEIEHDILRVEFEEPRIHFAIVCAAVSCPPLRSEAYLPDRLEEQLAEQIHGFLHDVHSNRFDRGSRTATLSPIFSWFKKDFGSKEVALLAFVAPYLDPETKTSIQRDTAEWNVDYSVYDWSLNDQ